jgi:hypothetical protein
VTSKVKATDRSKVAAYEQAGTPSESDKLSLSAKAKLMQTLRAEYENVRKPGEQEIQDLKKKIAEHGTQILSSEELVASILRGTLFEVI